MTLTLDSTAGVKLALHDLGGSGPALLLAHATGFNGRVYEGLAHYLQDLRVWAPDLRGHGDSTAPEDGIFAWEGLADDLGRVVDELEDELPILAFGHSMGAAVSLLTEARRPGTFRAIYAYEPIVAPPEILRASRRSGGILESTRRRKREFESAADALRNFTGKPPFDGFAESSLHKYVEHCFNQLENGRLRIKMDPDNEVKMYEMSSKHPTWDRLPEVRCPVMIASGRTLPETPSEWIERIARHLPNARTAVYEDLGHMGPFESPQRIAVEVVAFFGSIEAEGEHKAPLHPDPPLRG